jgi:hypothetical protein
MRHRRNVVALAVVAAFGAGLLTSRALEGEARAQRVATDSAVFVPSDGIAFRTLDGRVIARLGYDTKGGFLQLYDEHQRPGASVHGTGLAGARGVTTTIAPAPLPPPTAAGAAASLDLGY